MENKRNIDLKAASRMVFDHYLANHYHGGFVVLGKNISNPFLSTPQENPSFNILQARDGNLIYYDFATGDKGNCVSFVAKHKNTNQIEAIRLIQEILNNR
jgi:hypothetical protein